MFEPVKAGLGGFMQDFYLGLVPTTRPLTEFTARGFAQCVAWAPGRMVDKAEDMLGAWMKNDSAQAPTRPPKLPVILVGVANDYTPIAGNMGTQIADAIDVQLPGDDKCRFFQMRMVAGEVRAQVAIFAHDEPTAKSLAAQFLLFLSSPSRRGFDAVFPYAGVDNAFPVQIEAPDNPAMSIETGTKNLKVLAIDLTLICSIPLFSAPGEGEANDGKGIPGTADPAGFPLVADVDITAREVES
ncbi:hypothetical protein PU634_05095 [Oceanimonas pelagia]|uniref:Uncharacterized protein n=1 Tax=Oceanimonas pelagia TaxID=3028314 RepID=A0AA50KQA7_9GAMM|nr:hypothetical protein [Oceanimonas pelagia]WMC11744.1 hypothetical protein PU634_05095 [Oceanimonas pelagia]